MSRNAGRGPTSKRSADEQVLGDRVIALRSEGKSFAAIAKAVGVTRSLDAFTLFVSAVADKSPSEQKRLRAEENGRLDSLEKRTKRHPDETERARKLASIRKLRQRLAAS